MWLKASVRMRSIMGSNTDQIRTGRDIDRLSIIHRSKRSIARPSQVVECR